MKIFQLGMYTCKSCKNDFPNQCYSLVHVLAWAHHLDAIHVVSILKVWSSHIFLTCNCMWPSRSTHVAFLYPLGFQMILICLWANSMPFDFWLPFSPQFNFSVNIRNIFAVFFPGVMVSFTFSYLCLECSTWHLFKWWNYFN